MKNTVKISLSVLLTVVMLLLCFTACAGNKVNKEGLWENATYLQDKEFGSGKVTVQVEVKAGEQSVTFTIKTDKTTLGDALLEHKLIDGETSEFGLYVKVVNGITADYDIDQSYWSFCKNGEYMMVGVDGAEIADGEHYELVYTK